MVAENKHYKSLIDQIAELEEPTPKDFDPEDLSNSRQSSDGPSPQTTDAGREHYEVVGKSKLRKPVPVTLGRQYAGSLVSRNALNAEDSDDNESGWSTRSGDSEAFDVVESDELEGGGVSGDDRASGEGYVDGFNHFKSRGRHKSGTVKHADGPHEIDIDNPKSEFDEDYVCRGERGSSCDDTDQKLHEDQHSDTSGEDTNEERGNDDADRGSYTASNSRNVMSEDRSELRRLMASDRQAVAASISRATQADAAKGLAVRRQRKTFDALLSARIKLQKGLSTLDTVATDSELISDVNGDSIRSAEAAALTLWSTIETLRYALSDSRALESASKKRRVSPPPEPPLPASSLWKRMEEIEFQSIPHRRSVLDKWSLKVRGSRSSLHSSRGKLMDAGTPSQPPQQAMSAILDAYIAAEAGDRFSKRSRGGETQPLSRNASHVNTIYETYDDTPFYHTLLRDLVDQRMSSNGLADSIRDGAALQLQLPTQLSLNPITGARKDKIKKVVDTKASKGRKMRYTVHEKLQNFMAPEDRGSWGERAREEFFASLLGKSSSKILEEAKDDGGEETGVGKGSSEDEDLEEGGLKLFRN